MSTPDVASSPDIAVPRSRTGLLADAVHRFRGLSTDALRERLFTFLFRGLVYPQIWEDPVVDMEALRLGPGSRLLTIASGGCNAMSYLTSEVDRIDVVDLNRAHIALIKLKIAAAQHLPDYESFYLFFGHADSPENPRLYDRYLRRHLDSPTRRYWEGRDGLLRRRIRQFSRGFYRYGLFGRFIALAHFAARRYGVDLHGLLACRSKAEQAAWYDGNVGPLFDRGFIRWFTSKQASLFGLGIPPAQYEALAGPEGAMADVLRQRLRRVATEFPVGENYFAWQAFARQYAPDGFGPVPPYLDRANWERIRERASRIASDRISLTERLLERPAASYDGYVFLDAQDWMTDVQLDALWREVTRTARPGARVVFRTAAATSLLPGRLDPALLGRWHYEAEASLDYGRRDRSATYGGFHLYVLRD